MTKKLISEDFDEFLLDVEKETEQKEERNRYYLWKEWYNNWIDLFRWLDILIEEKREKSLFSIDF